MDLKNKVAFITGASSGIGRGLSLHLVREGCFISLVDLDEKGGKETEKLINESYPKSCIFINCDVSNFDNLKLAFEKTYNHFGHLDIVANNAGIGEPPFEFENGDLDEYAKKIKKVIDINLSGVIFGSLLATRYLKKNKNGGIIINTASIFGIKPVKFHPIYAGTKAGVINFTKSLKSLKDSSNIRINCICPNFTETPILGKVDRNQLIKLEGGILSVDIVVSSMINLIKDENLSGAALVINYNKPPTLWSNSKL